MLYSCQFNSIETLWSYVKRTFKQQAAINVGRLKNQAELVALVQRIAANVPERIAKAMLSANRAYLLQRLNIMGLNQ